MEQTLKRRELLDRAWRVTAGVGAAALLPGFALPAGPRVHRLQPERLGPGQRLFLVPADHWPYFMVQFGAQPRLRGERSPEGTWSWADIWRVERAAMTAAGLELTMAPGYDLRQTRRVLTLPRPLYMYTRCTALSTRRGDGFDVLTIEPPDPELGARPALDALCPWSLRVLRGRPGRPGDPMPWAWQSPLTREDRHG